MQVLFQKFKIQLVVSTQRNMRLHTVWCSRYVQYVCYVRGNHASTVGTYPSGQFSKASSRSFWRPEMSQCVLDVAARLQSHDQVNNYLVPC